MDQWRRIDGLHVASSSPGLVVSDLTGPPGALYYGTLSLGIYILFDIPFFFLF